MSRVCFLHAGTHKTGTKYLQSFLQRNEFALANDGLYVPIAGRTSQGAHHNIAWELAGDRRFNPALGTFKELVAELSFRETPGACMSSEDFQFLSEDVDTLRRVRSELNKVGYNVKVVFFLRPQADYAESMYTEFVKQGSKLDFLEFFELFTTGKIGEGLTPHYDLLLEPFVRVFGLKNVIARPFRDSDRSEHIVIDFLSQMLPGFDLSSGKYRTDRARENVSMPFAQVFQLFIRNNLGRLSESLEIDMTALAKSIQPEANGEQYLYGPFDPVDFKGVATMFWKAGISNLKVLRKHHVFIPLVSARAFRKDLLALLSFELDSRRRRSLIKRFRRNSSDLKAVLNELGEGGNSLETHMHSEETAGLAEENTRRIAQLSNELDQRGRELRDTKAQAAKAIEERDREIDRLRTELLSLQESLKTSFSASKIWNPIKHASFRQLASIASAGPVTARRLLSTFRNRKFARLIADSGLFDSEFYLTRKPELKARTLDPLAHFIEHGTEARRDPHPLFDTSYYLQQNPDILRARVNPLVHFIKYGAQERRSPHPLFDISFYLEQNLDIARTGTNPLVHFLTCGAYEGRNPCPLFDVSYYLEQNSEVAKAHTNPLVHFIQGGASQGCDPHPLFSTSYYLERNPEVAIEGLNPLVHFIRFGALQGCNPHPLFDISYYRQHNPDIQGQQPALHFLSVVNPLVHFLRYGVHNARDPHPLFNTSYYLEKNPDVIREGLNPLVHFLKRGAYEGRDPSPLFNVQRYLEENPAVARSRVNPLVHFILNGERQQGIVTA